MIEETIRGSLKSLPDRMQSIPSHRRPNYRSEELPGYEVQEHPQQNVRFSHKVPYPKVGGGELLFPKTQRGPNVVAQHAASTFAPSVRLLL